MQRTSAIGRDRRAQVLRLIHSNPVVCEILARTPALKLEDAWLTGSCLFQTCWNVLTGHRPTRAIRQYDVFYFDARDVSAGAEALVNVRARQLFGDLGCTVNVRNQARVQMAYDREHGVTPDKVLRRTTDGVDHSLAVCAMVAVRRGEEGEIELYAPLGVDDIVHRIIRPNPRLRAAPHDVYALKAERWSTLWPELVVAPFGARRVRSDG